MKLTGVLVALLALAVFGGSSEDLHADEATANSSVSFDFALYFAPKPIADAEAELSRRLRDTHRELRRGFEPNERLMVKAPFAYDVDNNEYMWVEVTGWKEEAITGVLMNDPYHVKGLKSGMRVTVKLSNVYDYLHYRPDGTFEGNETGKVLEKREAGW